jgi:hypothetical protein
MVAMLTQSQQEEMAREYQDRLSGRIGQGSGSYGMYLDSYFDRGQGQPRMEAGADRLARQRQMQQNQGRQRMLGGAGGLRDIFSGGIFGGQRPTDQGPLGGSARSPIEFSPPFMRERPARPSQGRLPPPSPYERNFTMDGDMGMKQTDFDNRNRQRLQGQSQGLQRQLGGLRDQMRQQFERTQGPETTRFVQMGGQEFRLTNPIPVSQPSQQGGSRGGFDPFGPGGSLEQRNGGYNRGINPGGMYTGGRGGGFGSPFGGSMRGGRQQPMPAPQPQYGGGFGGGFGGGMMPSPYGGGFGGGFGGGYGGFGGGFGRSPFQMPNMGYGNRFPGMQFSGPFAQPMMPQNYGMGSFGGFGGRFPMPQPRMPYPQFPMMGGGYGGGYGGTYGDGTIIG